MLRYSQKDASLALTALALCSTPGGLDNKRFAVCFLLFFSGI